MNKDNDIRREFQSMFGDYKAPLPADGWERIEQSMRAARATRVITRRRWYAGSAVAMMVMLIGSILFFRDRAVESEPLIAESASPASVTKISPENKGVVSPEPEASMQPVTRVRGSKQLFASRARYAQREKVISSSNPTAIVEAWLNRYRKEAIGANRIIDHDLLHDKMTALNKKTAKEADREEFITVGSNRDGFFYENESQRNQGERIILALNGRGGLTSFQQTVNSPMTLRSATLDDQNQYGGEPNKTVLTANNSAGNVSEMEHDQPVSFGFTLSKSLFDDLYIETGLVYTYLASKVRNTNTNFQVNETQRLHYLGIPLNVNYNLFSLNKLNVYASVGGMLEKDLYGEYRKVGEGQTEEFNSSSEEEEITRISQRNPQLSVNAGLGLSYPIYNGLKMYGKIGGAYYFDANNEYKTIYSDRKIVMDLNVGLRYEF
ncbi:MAG: hypothetical protein ITG04_03675 [Proteiniphilum sp.]|jgi:hypothetical protein|nr:hypothetical protein [Proteiniphilum sp.]